LQIADLEKTSKREQKTVPERITCEKLHYEFKISKRENERKRE